MKRLTLVLLVAALGVAIAMPAAGAGGIIINTIQGADDHAPGWSGSADALFSGSGGNTSRLILATGGHVQWRGVRNRWQLRAGYGYEESDHRTTARNGTIHLRHNYDITDALATVAFVQVQENPFQRIESRWLVGAGLRFDALDDTTTTLSIGATPMLEMERREGDHSHVARGRLSTFLAFSQRAGRKVTFRASGFVQPLFEDFGNLRTVGTATFVVDMTDRLDLKTGVSVETNSAPAPGVKDTDWSTYMSFGVNL